MRASILSLFLSVLLTLTARAEEEVLVFAAASLAGPLDDIAEVWEAETGHDVTLAYAGSSALARQVQAGAPADVLFLANTDWMEVLRQSGAVQEATIRTIVGNRLVLIINTQVHGAMDLDTVPDLYTGRFALALTESVPAGIYARAALEASGDWDELRDRVVEADNVRAATRLVAIGAVERGIVYATEAVAEPRVTVLGHMPEHLHPPIRYPVALTTGAGPEAAEFLTFLHGRAALAIFRDAGFPVLQE